MDQTQQKHRTRLGPRSEQTENVFQHLSSLVDSETIENLLQYSKEQLEAARKAKKKGRGAWSDMIDLLTHTLERVRPSEKVAPPPLPPSLPALPLPPPPAILPPLPPPPVLVAPSLPSSTAVPYLPPPPKVQNVPPPPPPPLTPPSIYDTLLGAVAPIPTALQQKVKQICGDLLQKVEAALTQGTIDGNFWDYNLPPLGIPKILTIQEVDVLFLISLKITHSEGTPQQDTLSAMAVFNGATINNHNMRVIASASESRPWDVFIWALRCEENDHLRYFLSSEMDRARCGAGDRQQWRARVRNKQLIVDTD